MEWPSLTTSYWLQEWGADCWPQHVPVFVETRPFLCQWEKCKLPRRHTGQHPALHLQEWRCLDQYEVRTPVPHLCHPISRTHEVLPTIRSFWTVSMSVCRLISTTSQLLGESWNLPHAHSLVGIRIINIVIFKRCHGELVSIKLMLGFSSTLSKYSVTKPQRCNTVCLVPIQTKFQRR